MSKPKSKTQKKIDTNICRALNQVCELSLEDIEGFQWLTHQADYTNFPASLMITCVFDKEAQLLAAAESGQAATLKKRIQAALLKIGVKFKAINQQIVLDSEEACEGQCQGRWEDHLARRAGRAVAKNRPV